MFWNTVNPFSSGKGATRGSPYRGWCDYWWWSKNVFNFQWVFLGVVSNLNISQYEDSIINLENINDPLEKARVKYRNHPSILAILQQFGKSFSLWIIPKEKMEKKVLSLNETKASQQWDIPTTIIKVNVQNVIKE